MDLWGVDVKSRVQGERRRLEMSAFGFISPSSLVQSVVMGGNDHEVLPAT